MANHMGAYSRIVAYNAALEVQNKALAERCERLEADIRKYKDAYYAVLGNPSALLSDPTSHLKCAESMQSLEIARLCLFGNLKESQ